MPANNPPRRTKVWLAVVLAAAAAWAFVPRFADGTGPLRFAVSFPAARSAPPLDGRMLVFVSDDGEDGAANADSTSIARLTTRPIFGVDVDGSQAVAGCRHRRQDRRMAFARSLKDIRPGRLIRLGAALGAVRDVPSRRRPHRQDADGSWGRTALGHQAGELLQQAGEDATSIPPPAARSGSPSIRRFRRFSRPTDTKLSNTSACRTIGSRSSGDVRCILARSLLLPGRMGHASQRALSAARPPRSLPGQHGERRWRETPPDPRARFAAQRTQQKGYQFYKDWNGPRFPA